MSVRQFAARLRVSPSTVSAWERDAKPLSGLAVTALELYVAVAHHADPESWGAIHQAVARALGAHPRR